MNVILSAKYNGISWHENLLYFADSCIIVPIDCAITFLMEAVWSIKMSVKWLLSGRFRSGV